MESSKFPAILLDEDYECGHERLLAFTCKSRHVCPACHQRHQRRVCATGNWIAETLCKPVPHRQFVFTIPRMLRGIFRKRRHLLDHLFRTATDSLRDWMRLQLDLPDGKLAAIAGVQTFGDYLVFHPHIHILSASGLFDQTGCFHLLPAPSAHSLEALTELFRHRFIATLVSNKLLTGKKSRDLLSWKRSGFNLDAGEKPVAADDVDGRRQLAEYLLRAPFSLQKITWKEETATVIYRSGRNWKTKRNFEVFAATDFLAAVVEHIPDRYHHTIRYYGVYSNKSRGLAQRRNQIPISCQCAHPETDAAAPAQPAPPTVSHHQTPNRRLRPLWRDLIMRVWGEDPLLCPKCKTTMKVVDKVLRPEEIEFFLKLHNLWEGILAIPPPPDPPFDVETMEPIRTPPEYQWWKPEASDPAQFELLVPHWSPDFEFQEWHHAADSAESSDSWRAREIILDAEHTLVLDSDPPSQDEFPELFYD